MKVRMYAAGLFARDAIVIAPAMTTPWIAFDPDIIGVCVRGPDHFYVMMQTIAASPKAIFLEKPPSCSLEQMDVMVAAARKKNVPITVSYSRHWARHVLELEKLVKDGLIGQVRMVLGYVGGNVLSFASHTTDLI